MFPPEQIIGTVKAVSKSSTHTLIKKNFYSIELIAGHGVKDDAHAGKTIKHRSRVEQDPTQPNLRQVHLMHNELFKEVSQKGLTVNPGEMGENITTEGIDILNLPVNTIMHLGSKAKIKITGLRSPCSQLNKIQEGLLDAVLDKDEAGNVIRKSGIMSVVIESGTVNVGDRITLDYPEKPYIQLEPV